MATPIPIEVGGAGEPQISAAPLTVKPDPQTVYAYTAVNPNAYPIYLRFYDKLSANVNVATDVPAQKITVPAATSITQPGLIINDSITWVFSVAISCRATTIDSDGSTQSPAASPRLDMQLDQASGSGSGDVVGPSSAVAGRVATFSGTSGKILQDSGVVVSGTNTGDQTSVSGNAGTATALATSRNIDGQAFDGTANITVIAPGTHAAASKATPVDADEITLVDSSASNVLKKLTWANLKATAKTYFDAIYVSGSGTVSGTNTGDQTITLTGDVTGSGTGSLASTVSNLPTGVTVAGNLLATAIAAPSTPAAGKSKIYVDSTANNLAVKNDSGVVSHTVKTKAAVADSFVNSIADDGTVSVAQPSFANVSGTAATTQMPAFSGDFTTSSGSTVAKYTPVTQNLGNGGTVTVNSTTPPTTRLFLNTVLLSDLTINLPAASGYTPSTPIEIIDTVAGGAQVSHGVTLNHNGSDTVDGGSTLVLSRGSGYVRLNSDGSSKWSTTKYSVVSVVNPGNSAGFASFTTTALTAARAINTPDTDSTLMSASNPATVGWVKDVNIDGSVTKTQVHISDLVPTPFSVGQLGVDITGTSSVTNNGSWDVILILGNVNPSLTLQLPDAGQYQNGEELRVIDVSGSVSSGRVVTITSTNGTDTFDFSLSSVTLNEQFGKRAFTSDGLANWSVSAVKASIAQPYTSITPVSGTYTLQIDNNASGSQNAHLVLGSGVNILAVKPAPYDGMRLDLTVVQPPSGAAGTLVLPAVSLTPSGGAGLITLSSTNNFVDRITASYDAAQGYLWGVPMLNFTSAALPTAPSALTVGTITSNSIAMSFTDNASNETGFDVERALDVSGSPGTFMSVATLGPSASTGGTVNYTDTGLAPSTKYYYKAAAVNSAGSSAFTSNINGTTGSSCSTPADTIGTWVSTGQGISIANGTSSLFIACNNYVPSSTNNAPCRINAAIYKANAPVGTLTGYIYSVTGSPDTPNTLLYTSTNSFTSTAVTNGGEPDALLTPLSFAFSGVSLTVGTQYFFVVGCSAVAVNASTNRYVWVTNGSQTSTWLSYRSANGSSWVAFTSGANNKMFIKTFK